MNRATVDRSPATTTSFMDMSDMGDRKKYTDEEIRKAVEKHGSNPKAIAEELGCHRSTVYRRWGKAGVANDDSKQDERKQVDLNSLVPDEPTYWVERPVDRAIEDAYSEPGPVLLIGPTGVGKTECTRRIAATLELPFLRVSFNQNTDFEEIAGRLDMTDGNVKYRKGLLLQVMQVPSIILLDEVNAVSGSTVGALNQLLDSLSVFISQSQEIYHMHADAAIFLAVNPPTYRYAVNPLSATLASRCSTVWVDPFSRRQAGRFLSGKYPDLPEGTKEALLDFYEEMLNGNGQQSLRAQISIRELDQFANHYMRTGVNSQALRRSFIDGVAATDGPDAREACLGIARTCFGNLWEKEDE